MTDLERAQTLINDFVSGLLPTPPFPQMIADALAAARREGAEEMRERALEAARDGVRVAFGERRDEEFIGESDVIGSIEDALASALAAS